MAFGSCIARGAHVVYSLAHTVRPDIAGWSSLVARRAHNPEVVGSNPAPATKKLQASCLRGWPFSYHCSWVFVAQVVVAESYWGKP